LENEVTQLDDRARSMIPDCNSFIQKYETVLHPNHYMLTDIKMMLCHASACDPATRYVIPGKNSLFLFFTVNFIPNLILAIFFSNRFVKTELDKTEAEILKLLELVKVISPGIILRRIYSNLFLLLKLTNS